MTTRREFIKSAAVLAGTGAGLPALTSLGLPGALPADETEGGVPEFKLPSLPYLPEALEPHLDGRTLRIHHMKQHALHVIGLNKALKQLHEAREKNDFTNIQAQTRAMTVHAAGHINHTCYFAGMAPVGRGGGTKPVGEFAQRIDRDFGSYEKFKAQFTAAALSIDGNGWAVLAYNPEPLDRLFILQLTQEQDCASLGMIPLVMIDMWEHAYYLKYQYKRDEYVAAWWNVVYWKDAAKRYVIMARS